MIEIVAAVDAETLDALRSLPEILSVRVIELVRDGRGTRMREDKQIITLEDVAKSQSGEVVITGESVVLVEDLTP